MITLQAIREASGGKEAYKKFFDGMLKKFGVSSQSELEGDQKKKFYDAIDSGWEGDNEKPEANESVDLEEGKLDDFDKAYNTWHTATGKLTKAFNAAATDKKALKRYKDAVENIEVAIDRAKMKD